MSNKNVKLIISAKDQNAASTIKGIERGFTSLKDSVFSMQGALSAIGITATLASATNAAKEAQNANIGLAVSARYAGQSIDGTLAAAQALTQDGLLTMTEASLGLKNLLARGFSLDEATNLMNRFKDSAAFGRQASLGFGEAVVSATEGLKNENSILVDNAGVTKNVSVMWKEYAATIGTTADKLTQAQKREAEYQGVLIETEGQLGNAARSSQTMAGMQAQLAAETTKAQIALGNSLTPALLEILPILTGLAGGVGQFIGGLQMMAAETAGFADKINVLLHFDTVGAIFGDTTFDQQAAIVKARFAEINQLVEEQKQEIYDKATSVTAPDIGKDSGARRKDIVVPPAGRASGAKGGGDKYDAAAVDKEMEIDRINSAVDAYVAGQKYLREKEADERAQNLQAKYDSDARALEDKNYWLSVEKEMELDAIRARVDAHLAGQSMITLAAQEGHRQRLEFERATGAQQLSIVTSDLIAMTQRVAGNNKAMFRINQAARVLEAGQEGVKGAIKTWNSYAYPWNIPMTALHVAGTAVQMQQLLGAGQQGGGTNIGQGGGTSTSPIVTQPAGGSQIPTGQSINVQIMGNVIGQDKWVEEELVPALRNLGSRNITITA